jgi:hypothetical protein
MAMAYLVKVHEFGMSNPAQYWFRDGSEALKEVKTLLNAYPGIDIEIKRKPTILVVEENPKIYYEF